MTPFFKFPGSKSTLEATDGKFPAVPIDQQFVIYKIKSQHLPLASKSKRKANPLQNKTDEKAKWQFNFTICHILNESLKNKKKQFNRAMKKVIKRH